MTNRERRRTERLPYGSRLRICSEDGSGNTVFGHAQCVDVSEGGLRIETQASVPVGTYVSLRSDQLNFGGSARVKRVVRKGSKYCLGLELSEPLRTKPLPG